jgi:hypothetical protein
MFHFISTLVFFLVSFFSEEQGIVPNMYKTESADYIDYTDF